MFSKTREAMCALVNNIKNFLFVCRLTAPTLTFAYMIYMICMGGGVMGINIALAALSLGYAVFVCLTRETRGKEGRRLRRFTKRAYKRAKLVLRGISLAAVIYGAYVATTEASAPAVSLAVVSIVLWLVELICTLTYDFLAAQVKNLVESVKEDVITPISRARGKLSRLFGKRREGDIYYDEIPKDAESDESRVGK